MCNIICQLEPDEGPTTLCTSLCAADFLIFFHMKTVLRQLHDHPSITKAASRLFLSNAISKQLNAAPYPRHKPWLYYYDRANRTLPGLASFPGLQSPNAVEGLVKILRRMTSVDV